MLRLSGLSSDKTHNNEHLFNVLNNACAISGDQYLNV